MEGEIKLVEGEQNICIPGKSKFSFVGNGRDPIRLLHRRARLSDWE